MIVYKTCLRNLHYDFAVAFYGYLHSCSSKASKRDDLEELTANEIIVSEDAIVALSGHISSKAD